MHWLSVFAAAVLFAAACNLDTVLLPWAMLPVAYI